MPVLVAENITKKFPGITALDAVNIELQAGKVTAIIGENGAGKSTLMKILSGVYPDYDGRILFKGNCVKFDTPRQAQQCGIAIIHQELNLIPHLSITENVFLGRELTNGWGMLDKASMQAVTQNLLKRLKLNIDCRTKITDLKVGQQQIVEIAKALLTDAEVIIMDEPTSAISDSEVEALFAVINDLRKDNKTIAYISHKLDELFKIADNYIILRDGRTIESGEIKAITRQDIISKMVGRDLHILQKTKVCLTDKPLLSVKNLSLPHPENTERKLLNNICLALYPGEVLGIFGLMGAGRTELLETIFGLRDGATGLIDVNGGQTTFTCPADAIRSGIALVPEDRKKDGLILGLDVKSNISITTLKDLKTAGLLNDKKEHALADKYIRSLNIKTSSQHQTVKNLSGGNQQKVVLAKCLATQPIILMLDEPTRGIDINAKNEIYKLILELAAEGLGIVMVSSELPEILAISSRVLVMCEGCITAEIDAAVATEDMILKAAITPVNQ
jgi:ribose transport system ATP-binding protein